jgi:hypothetical protein
MACSPAKSSVQRRGRLLAQHSENDENWKRWRLGGNATSIAEQRRVLLGFKTSASLPRRFSPHPGQDSVRLPPFSTTVHVFFRIADEMSVGPIH